MENGKEGKFLSSSQELHYVDEDEGGDLFHVKSVSGNVSSSTFLLLLAMIDAEF